MGMLIYFAEFWQITSALKRTGFSFQPRPDHYSLAFVTRLAQIFMSGLLLLLSLFCFLVYLFQVPANCLLLSTSCFCLAQERSWISFAWLPTFHYLSLERFLVIILVIESSAAPSATQCLSLNPLTWKKKRILPKLRLRECSLLPTR